MKNFVQNGCNLELTAPYDRLSGEGALVGRIFGVALHDVLSGAPGVFVTEGVFTLAKTGAQAITEGARVFWNDTTKLLTTTASGNFAVAVAVVAAGASDATAVVKLVTTTAAEA